MQLAFKRCSKCGRRLPMDDFGNDGKNSLGKKPDCRRCRSAAHAEYIRTPQGREVQRRANERSRNHPDQYMRSIIFKSLKARYGIERSQIQMRLLRYWEQPRVISIKGVLRPVIAVWGWRGRDAEEFVVHL
jgi:hypothetical protein